jgi:hypothetical protein
MNLSEIQEKINKAEESQETATAAFALTSWGNSLELRGNQTQRTMKLSEFPEHIRQSVLALLAVGVKELEEKAAKERNELENLS